jgi:hypothetical protein
MHRLSDLATLRNSSEISSTGSNSRLLSGAMVETSRCCLKPEPAERRSSSRIALVSICLLPGHAQFRSGGRGFNRMPDTTVPPEFSWEIDPAFKEDVFVFARLEYERHDKPRTRGGYWWTDGPDADFNFTLRLHQMTSLKVRPGFNSIPIEPEALSRHPFVYMIEPGKLEFRDDEIKALREYLLNGGFMMVDDFWGDGEWSNFEYEMKRVFPERKWHELELDHPIFHTVFDLKEKPQLPAIENFIYRDWTFERRDTDGDGELDNHDPHYRALYDDKGRMMVIACHNTDLGDGWEREGEDERYFRQFSEKFAYPMTINIIFYAMTH